MEAYRRGREKAIEQYERQHQGKRSFNMRTMTTEIWHSLLDDETWVGPYEVGMFYWLVDEEASSHPDHADPLNHPVTKARARMQLIRKAFNHLSSEELVELRASITNQLVYRDMKREGEEDA